MTATGADLSWRPGVPAAAQSNRYPPLLLRRAQDYANKIAEWIAPHCLQIEPVGEIRRQCATCSRVELLVVPRRAPDKANLLFNWLDDYVQNSDGRGRWRHETGREELNGLQPRHDAQSGTVYLAKCVLTIHCAMPPLWFLRLFETTGSEAHCASVAERVRALPGQWVPTQSIRVRGTNVVPASEGQIYEMLKMPFAPPWKRTD